MALKNDIDTLVKSFTNTLLDVLTGVSIKELAVEANYFPEEKNVTEKPRILKRSVVKATKKLLEHNAQVAIDAGVPIITAGTSEMATLTFDSVRGKFLLIASHRSWVSKRKRDLVRKAKKLGLKIVGKET